MPNDPQDDLLRQQAHVFAAKLVRSPALAIGYRDALSEAVEDSDFDGKLRDWIISSGFTTDRARIAAAFEDAPRELLAVWDGFYLVEVDKTIAALQIDALGVQLNGLKVADATFADGVLRFSPTKLSPWSGELTFSHAGWDGETPFPPSAPLQKFCKGHIWGAGAKRPEAANAAGATKLVFLGSWPVQGHAAAALASAGDAAVDWTFFTQFFGSYVVHWTEKPLAGPTIRQLSVAAANGGIAVQFSNKGSTQVILTTPAQHPAQNRLKFHDDKLSFELEFGQYGDRVRTFVGKIYPKGGAVPKTNNAVGSMEIAESHWDSYLGLALGIGGILLSIGGLLASLMPKLATKQDADDIKAALDDINTSSWEQIGLLKAEVSERDRAFERLDQEFNETRQAHDGALDHYNTRIGELNRDLRKQRAEIAQLQIDRAAAIRDGQAEKAERLRLEEEAKSSAERTNALEAELTEERRKNADEQRQEAEHEQKEVSEMKK
jgi:hypothetical protein